MLVLFALVLERNLYLGAKCTYLTAFDLHIKLLDFSYSQVAQGF